MNIDLIRQPFPPSRRIHHVLQSIINERVDVSLETVDQKTILISMAVTDPLGGHVGEGLLGVAAALPVRDAYAIYRSLGKMLGISPT